MLYILIRVAYCWVNVRRGPTRCLQLRVRHGRCVVEVANCRVPEAPGNLASIPSGAEQSVTQGTVFHIIEDPTVNPPTRYHGDCFLRELKQLSNRGLLASRNGNIMNHRSAEYLRHFMVIVFKRFG